jgi:hypothetical protein
MPVDGMEHANDPVFPIMNPGGHQIRLNGPWAASLSGIGNGFSARISVKTPADWTSWLGASPIDGLLRLGRSFNWTFPDPAPRSVELRIRGHSQFPASVALNGVRLTSPRSGQELVEEIGGLLQSHNQLELVFELAGFDPSRPLMDLVFLAISDRQTADPQ